MIFTSILPKNSNNTEKTLEKVAGIRLENIKVDFDLLSDPDRCPAEFLPYLAWSVGVEVWDKDFINVESPSDLIQRRREIIKIWPKVKRLRGTRAAIEMVFNILGVVPIFKLWWDLDSPSHKFKIVILNKLNNRPVDSTTYQKLIRIVDSLKPLSTSYQLDIIAKYDLSQGHLMTHRATRIKRFSMLLKREAAQ
jgi:phage tail P2-like protein